MAGTANQAAAAAWRGRVRWWGSGLVSGGASALATVRPCPSPAAGRRALSIRARQHAEMGMLALIAAASAFALYGASASAPHRCAAPVLPVRWHRVACAGRGARPRGRAGSDAPCVPAAIGQGSTTGGEQPRSWAPRRSR